ncbi:ribosome maturation factor RimM [Thermus filiformis]|uniref:Ribosome maturation factor RimM n=1 Tax=Thermus filiformis TaxID=276 RepID=A0A0D6XCE5_THEFI|nr:ribosome maturation factor RimM [Thermus filiformis]KIX84533.1 16S rRNA-processing protein RimM [Thermus filiformis]
MGRLVEIGRLGSPYALAGGLKFRGEEVILHLERVYIEGQGFRAIRDVFRAGSDWVVQLLGVTSREMAEALVGLRVYALEEELPPLEEGRFYYFRLIGLPVYVGEALLGRVVDVLDTGAQDVLVVEGEGPRLRDRAPRLIPLQAPYVRVEEGSVWVEPIEGLLD